MAVKKKRPGEPKMPSYAAYSYFAAEQLTLLKNKSKVNREHLKGVHSAWWSLSKKEKEHYQSKVHVNLKRYSAELQKWFKTLHPKEQESYLKENPRKSFFLDRQRKEFRKEDLLNQPSDSEDEIMEISSDEEESFNHFEEEEEEVEDEDENITFDIR